MSLSREARIILGILILAGAGFVWVNFFNQPDFTDAGLSVAQGGTFTPIRGSEVAVALPEGSAVAGEVAPVVSREVVIAELPFLITAPPAQAVTEADEVEEEALTRPDGQQRATVNPFSPIIVRQPPAPSQPQVASAPAPQQPAPQVVPVPSAPPPAPPTTTTTAPAPQRIAAPPPSPLAPPAPRSSALPRTLPGGTLPLALEPLQTARATEVAPPMQDLAEIATIRVPEPSAQVTVLEPTPVAAAPESEVALPSEPEPLASVRSPSAAEAPLFAGTSELSRYLRDNNVTFTGAVLGPVGVGIFRTSTMPGPVVVSLGQAFPGTDITLTDLSAHQAELTQGASKHILTLDLRR
jgi:hypothetical protein